MKKVMVLCLGISVIFISCMLSTVKVSASEILTDYSNDNTSAYVGKRVSITGVISEINDSTVSMGNDNPLGTFGSITFYIRDASQSSSLKVGQKATITGDVYDYMKPNIDLSGMGGFNMQFTYVYIKDAVIE